MAEIRLSYERMMGYLPPYWRHYPQMRAILKALGLEIDDLDKQKDVILTDAFILEMGESRIEEWERWLGLPPNGTLMDRRLAILEYFAVINKMTKESIKALVSQLYEGARAEVVFEDSTIKIEVKPLPENDKKEYDFSILYNQLYMRKPCHISLDNIKRFYCSWGDIKRGFNTWQALKDNRPTWNDVKLFILD